jgi:uncharacterized OB-fold protein
MFLPNRPLPTVTSDSAEFWSSARERAVRLQRCERCGEYRYYPSPICHFCSSDEFTWQPISGAGTIYSYTVLERAKGNPFEGDVPITIVLVELAEGPVMMSNLIDGDPADLAIGARVTIDYADVDGEVTLPVFRLVEEPAHDAGR